MRSVGEVMAIGRCLEEALQKAVRMLDIGRKGLVCNEEDAETESAEKTKMYWRIRRTRDFSK